MLMQSSGNRFRWCEGNRKVHIIFLICIIHLDGSSTAQYTSDDWYKLGAPEKNK
jgi:hypothetical protein